jgi:hypothetical protein
MSNYISNDNQRLLWKMAHQIQLFAQLDPPKKEFEFKQVVEFFYQKVANRPLLTTVELQQLNRETLSVFLPKPPLNPNPSSSSSASASVPYEMVESRQDKSMRAFQERQDMYENMNKKPDLPNPDEIFGEKKLEEEKIKNMDDLIYNYQKQREIDFNAISPPNILPSSKTNTAPSPSSKKLKLLDETFLTENDVDDLDQSHIQSKKSVSWNTELLQPPEWQKKMDSLELKIKELEEKNNSLEKRIDSLESISREKKITNNVPKMKNMLKEMEISNIVDSTLQEMVHKIEKIDNIKSKMKMFS